MLQLFELLSIFDWVTPAKGFVEDVINDPTLLQSNSWTFFVPYHQSLEQGWNAKQIKNLMDVHGVHHWGSQITGGEYFFSVKLDQAGWAEYVLLSYGIPLWQEGAPQNYIDPPSPRPERSMNNASQFAPASLTIIGPSLGQRMVAGVLRWIASKV